eukprot:TRINITY_DN22953_c0_g1_i1.p1 TRINITY_DN22953_c0_g1~~TRINITY_DN22953_c0_g1_i1.p1  ORF type:complete len:740 (-),score=184.29 TRINITY_DN22953_c0_g1_i1:320-2539(-)
MRRTRAQPLCDAANRRRKRQNRALAAGGTLAALALCSTASPDWVSETWLHGQASSQSLGAAASSSSASGRPIRRSLGAVPQAAPRSQLLRRNVSAGSAADVPALAEPAPLFTAPLRRLTFGPATGAGFDCVDVRIVTAQGDPVDTTFMLDSGLTTNLITPELMERLGLQTRLLAMPDVEGSALGGVTNKLPATLLPGLELLGDALKTTRSSSSSSDSGRRFEGTWSGGGWRARCALDWDAWVAEAAANDGRVQNGEVEYSVLPSAEMTDDQVLRLVGNGCVEKVEGKLQADAESAGGSRFLGKAVDVEPKGLFAATEKYDFREDPTSGDLRDAVSGMTLSPVERPRKAMPLRGMVHSVCTDFAQAQLAKQKTEARGEEHLELGGMLGQLPLYRNFATEVTSSPPRLSLYAAADAAKVARAKGLVRAPAQDLARGLIAVSLVHAPLLSGPGSSNAAAPPSASGLWRRPAQEAADEGMSTVPAMVDSGAAYSILNWPAAEKLLGIRESDRIVREAPMLRAMGVGGKMVDMPVLTVSLGLATEKDEGSGAGHARFRPVKVGIGDVEVFEDLFGREATTNLPFGLGTKPLKPAALLAQDMLTQSRYIMSADEPALYISERKAHANGLNFVGLGDCRDAEGRLLRGLQRLGCTPDEAAWECLALNDLLGSSAGEEACKAVGVTPSGRFQGLCYIFVDDDKAAAPLLEKGWRRFEAKAGEDLAPAGASIDLASGDQEAECYAVAR